MSNATDKARPTIGRLLALLIGLACYVLHWATFIYMMGFLSDLFVQKTIDIGEGPLGSVPGILIDGCVILVFLIPHWVMAQPRFKAWWTRIVPPPIERSIYVLISSLAWGLIFYGWVPLQGTVWAIKDPLLDFASRVAYWIGWALAIYATFPIDHWDLFGVRQVLLYYRGIPYTGPKGYNSIVYRLLLHPIFIGYTIIAWATPHMSVGHFLLAALLTLFIVVDVKLASLKRA